MLRFPDGMRDRLKAVAETNGRSMNAEIVQRLLDSFSDQQAVRLLHERRKLELLASYVEWCNKKRVSAAKSFIAYAAAYEEAMNVSFDLIGNPEMKMISGVVGVDYTYLSELYANWIIERPGRFPELADKEKSLEVIISADKSVTVKDVTNSLREIEPMVGAGHAMSLRLVVNTDETG